MEHTNYSVDDLLHLRVEKLRAEILIFVTSDYVTEKDMIPLAGLLFKLEQFEKTLSESKIINKIQLS